MAASLKAYGLWVGSVPTIGWLSLPSIQIAVVAAEVLLAVWLVSGVATGAAWLAAVVTFSSFALVSAYLGYLGVASCGCFGVVAVSPWVSFLIDTVVLCLLCYHRTTALQLRTDVVRLARPVAVGSVTIIAVAAILMGVGIALFGSVAASMVYLRGESLSYPTHLELGSGRPGDTLECSVDVTNHSKNAITLLGGTSDCTCVTTDSLPIILQPDVTARFSLRLRIPNGKAGALTRTATVFTDAPNQPAIGIHLLCYVAGAKS